MARAWQRWRQLGGRVRPVLGDACLVGKGGRPAAVGLRGSNPVQCCFLIRGRSGGRPVTCDLYSPTVTARARQGPAVLGAVRTRRGSVSLRNGGRPIRRHGAAVSALAIQLALIVPLKAPAVQVELAANPVEPVAKAGHGLLPWRCRPVGSTVRIVSLNGDDA
jgi:hypothetical protein